MVITKSGKAVDLILEIEKSRGVKESLESMLQRKIFLHGGAVEIAALVMTLTGLADDLERVNEDRI